MAWFIVGLLLLLIGTIVLLVGLLKKTWLDDGSKYLAVVAGFLIGLLGFSVVVADSFTVIPARNVGVVNTFGNAEGTLSNGFHWVKPWSSIETVDATVQNINGNSGSGNCITVRLANQTTACVDFTVQWNIDQHADANNLWKSYRGTNDDVVGNIRNNVVLRELQRSFNVVFEIYNPLSVLTGAEKNLSTDDLAGRALTEVKGHVDAGIVVDTIRISIVHFDEVTQNKLNGYAQALADTQIATQQKLTAEQQKAANDILANASSNDAGVKYQNCINLVKDLAAKGQLQNLPATFNCSDGSTPVIVGK